MNDEAAFEIAQEIGGILFRKLRGDWSEADRNALEQWLQQQTPAYRTFIDGITSPGQVETALRTLYGIDEQVAWEQVLAQAGLQTVPLTPVKQRGRTVRYTVYKYLAAAAITGIVATGIVWMLRRDRTDIGSLPVAERYHNDVQPGGNHAMLKLASGAVIGLDTAANGHLLQAGNTTVSKQDGQLVYQPDHATPAAVQYNTLEVPRGGQYRLTLPDGTGVWLNAQSSLRYPTAFTGQERQVELTGEAYFEVAANTRQPFKVAINRAQRPPLQVTVLGTAFDVQGYDDEPVNIVTLLQGAVRITAGEDRAVLQPQDQATLPGVAADAIKVAHAADAAAAVSWKDGLFHFEDASIESIMRQVARWYDVEVTYKGKVEKLFYGKIPRGSSLSTLLQILESTGGVHFVIDAQKITVLP